MDKKEKILICGILPPPFFGHSMIYKVLMQSGFTRAFNITFLDMRFWSYKDHKKITFLKLVKFAGYFFCYVFLVITRRPKYILYNISFDKMPFLKDFLFCWTGRILGGRIVLHDMGQYIGELYRSSNRFYRWLIRRLGRIVTASIVLGEAAREVYKEFINRDKVFVVPGSVEDSCNVGLRNEESPLSFPVGERVNVLYFSFLSASKGLWTALQAIPEVIKANPHVFFTFGGPMESNSLQEEMNRYIVRHNLELHVKYLGYVASEDKRTEIFRGSDIFIFPTHRDVFGLVLLHAMAEGLPVVASREGAIPEIVQDGENGFLFTKGNHLELAEKIILLAKDRALRNQMGRRNRQRYYAYYTPEKYGQRMIDVFDKIQRLA